MVQEEIAGQTSRLKIKPQNMLHPTHEPAPETTEGSAEELQLQLNHAKYEAEQWKKACATGDKELRRTQMLLEVAETKYANLEKILQAHPAPGRKAREVALELAVQLSGQNILSNENEVLKVARVFENWLTSEPTGGRQYDFAKAPADGGQDR
jgi:hypothetical protein